MSSAQKILVCVATYNEIENLPRLVDAIETNLPAADVLVIDDGSPDGTGRWCDECAALIPGCVVYIGERKLGLGTAILAAMRYAIDHDYQYLVNMDADFSHPPERLPDLVGKMDHPSQEADVMIGSRYIPGGGVEGWPWRRHLMSRGVNCYSRCLLGLTAKDVSGGYRCYRTSLLRRLDFDSVAARGYAFQEEILWRLNRLAARFGETPFVFVDRRAGRSKINVKEMVTALWVIFVLGVRNWSSRPGRRE